MTRHELEQLCQPQTPEGAADGLVLLHDALSAEGMTDGDSLESLNAGARVLDKLIEEITMPATVKIRRSIW